MDVEVRFGSLAILVLFFGCFDICFWSYPVLLNFDYDGVIVDSFDQLLSLTVRAQEALSVGRMPTANDFRTIENLTFEDLGRLIGIPEEKLSRYGQIIFDLQAENWTVDVFPEIVPVFEKLSQENKLVVITSSRTTAVLENLNSFGLGAVISMVLGGELGLTKAQRIEEARNDFGVECQDTFMIGDAISDIRQGKIAGVRTIATAWGFQERALLERESPDFIADHPRELLEIVASNK
jgi:phosphoglycolate phosphatase